MSEAKHTPGPWVRGDGDPHQILSSLTWDCVAEVNDALPEGEANANLIAAAPELLAALEAMIAKATKQNWNDNYPDQLAQAFAALDKAKGHSL